MRWGDGMIKDILEDYGVYSFDLELALLRHFARLRNEILKEGQRMIKKEELALLEVT